MAGLQLPGVPPSNRVTLCRFMPGDKEPIIRYDVASASRTMAIAECSGPILGANCDAPPPIRLKFGSAAFINDMDAKSAAHSRESSMYAAAHLVQRDRSAMNIYCSLAMQGLRLQRLGCNAWAAQPSVQLADKLGAHHRT
jgi:hypothetical protein